MTSEDLQQMAWAAEDNGSEVEVYKHEAFDELIQYIEVDGVTYLNDELSDEVEDLQDAIDWQREGESWWNQ